VSLLRLFGIEQAFQLRQQPAVLFAAGGAFGFNQAGQVKRPNNAVEGLHAAVKDGRPTADDHKIDPVVHPRLDYRN